MRQTPYFATLRNLKNHLIKFLILNTMKIKEFSLSLSLANQKQWVISMKTIRLNLFCVVSFLLFTLMTTHEAYAITNIPNGNIVTAPPQADDQMNFQAPAPGGTFIISTPTTFTGAITNAAAGVGTLVLNSGTQLNGAVGTGVSPLLQVNLTGNATINGAVSAQTFNLGQNTLNQVGALNLPSGIVFNTRVVSNALFGNITTIGADSIAGASVLVNVDASGVIALTPGQPLFILPLKGLPLDCPLMLLATTCFTVLLGIT